MRGVYLRLIPIEYLKKIETISSLKLLVYFYENANDSGIVRESVSGLVSKSGLARNSIKKALLELTDNNIVKKVAEGKGNQPNTYKVSKFDSPTSDSLKVDPVTEVQGWKKATGARKKPKEEPKEEPPKDLKDNNNILLKDFKEFNFINNNINSLSIVNENIYLTDEQLGKLARRVLVEWFLPLADLGKVSNHFFPQQMKMLKDLLVKYRTEQVLASIEYWTKVNPPKNGMKSLAWLNFERKKVSHVLVALDYYKQQYIEKQSEVEEEQRKAKVEEMKANALEIVRKKQEEKNKVTDMDDNEFLSGLLGSFGKIETKKGD